VGSSARGLVARIRLHTDLPIAVGFGISTFEQIADVWSFADAAVVGSAIVSKIADAPNATNAVAEVESFVRMLLPKFAKRGVEN
jgi:tryptophan synthase alpha chain